MIYRKNITTQVYITKAVNLLVFGKTMLRVP